MNELTNPNPEGDRPLAQPEDVLGEVQDAKREAKRIRLQTAIPTIKAIKDELLERAADGRLKEQLKSRSIGSLIKDLAVIRQVLEDNMPQTVILAPPAPATQDKDVTWQRAHSATRLTESERKKLRIEVEKPKEDK